MRPRDSFPILSAYVIITTALAFGFGFALSGLFMGLGSAFAAFAITSAAAIVARKELKVLKIVTRVRVIDVVMLSSGAALIILLIVSWMTGEVLIVLLGALPLLSLIAIRSIIRRQQNHQA